MRRMNRLYGAVFVFFALICAAASSLLFGAGYANAAENNISEHTDHALWNVLGAEDLFLKGEANSPLYYYLDSDVSLDGTLRIEGEVVLCLNGHILSGSGAVGERVINVTEGSKLTVLDCNEERVHSYYKEQSGMPIFMTDSFVGTIPDGAAVGEVRGGVITGGKARDGGCMYLNGAELELYGGTVAGNVTGGGYGGGLYLSNASRFTMYGGSISMNEADISGGAVYLDGNSVMKMYGGEICENSAANQGDAVYAGLGKAEIFGGYIQGQLSTDKGDIDVLGGCFADDKNRSHVPASHIMLAIGEDFGDSDYSPHYPFVVYERGVVTVQSEGSSVYDGKSIACGEDFILCPTNLPYEFSWLIEGEEEYSVGLPSSAGEYIVCVRLTESVFDDAEKVYFEKSSESFFEYEIVMADAHVQPPEVEAIAGQKLSEVVLPSGWEWCNGDEVLDLPGEVKKYAVYTPEDENYNSVKVEITIIVSAADAVEDEDGGQTPSPDGGQNPSPDGGQNPSPDDGQTPSLDDGQTPSLDDEQTPSPDGEQSPSPDDGQATPPEGGNETDDGAKEEDYDDENAAAGEQNTQEVGAGCGGATENITSVAVLLSIFVIVAGISRSGRGARSARKTDKDE